MSVKRTKIRQMTLLCIGLPLILAGVYFVGLNLKYRYWNFFVHKQLTIFLDKEFREIIHEYAKNKNFASIVERNKVGFVVTYKVFKESNIAIQLRLEKDLSSNVFIFLAEISSASKMSHYDRGNPPIYMEIPMKYFESVMQSGLSISQVNRLLSAASSAGWEPIGFGKHGKARSSIALVFEDNG